MELLSVAHSARASTKRQTIFMPLSQSFFAIGWEITRIEKRIWPGLSANRDGKAVLWAQINQERVGLMLVKLR